MHFQSHYINSCTYNIRSLIINLVHTLCVCSRKIQLRMCIIYNYYDIVHIPNQLRQTEVLLALYTCSNYCSHSSMNQCFLAISVPFQLDSSWGWVGGGCCQGHWEEEEGMGRGTFGS